MSIMFHDVNPYNLIYLDIETAMIEKDFCDLPERIQEVWEAKFKDKQDLIDSMDKPNAMYDKLWKEQAALYPEFAKVICVTIGEYDGDTFDTTSFYEGSDWLGAKIQNEKELLGALKSALDVRKGTLIAHNGKGFDYPFLTKRYLINKLIPAKHLWIYGKKPWEIALFDTMEIWKFGSYRGTSLDAIALAFDLPSPKEDINGSTVWEFYYGDPDGKEKIAKYCTNDVITLCNVVNKMLNNNYPIVPFH